MKYILIYLSLKYQGDFDKIYQAIKNKEKVSDKKINETINLIRAKKILALTIVDSNYPKELKLINRPPFVLFYKGNLDLLKISKICLTGRIDNQKYNFSNQIKQACKEITKSMALITNLYRGTDQEIVEEIEKRNGYLVLVSANGTKNAYFAKNKFNYQKTLIISEYPDNVNLSKKKLRQRNRIVAGLGCFLIILSSSANSGIMNLVSYFLENGKEIYCYPECEKNENDGNYLLLREGANLITKIENKTIN